jgi:hypothetical protein
MNIQKTNRIGLKFVEQRFSGFRDMFKDGNGQLKNPVGKGKAKKGSILFRTEVLSTYPRDTKVLRLTKKVIEACKMIDINSIKENINVEDFNFNSIVILLDKDATGIIKIVRQGCDFDFFYMSGLGTNKYEDVDKSKAVMNTYSFLTKEFNIESIEAWKAPSIFVVQILAYLYYGQITNKFIKAKSTTKLSSFSKFVNNSPFDITYVDTLWKQRISTEGFKVRGHFRLQPVGEGRIKKKLIWIEEFDKTGYNRQATREKFKNLNV